MSIICIPVCVYSPIFIIRDRVTNVVRERVSTIWTETYFDGVFEITNRIWRTAQIEFIKQSFTAGSELELPGSHGAEALTTDDQVFLCFSFQPATGVSVVLVNQALSHDPAAVGIGGAAIERYRACVLTYTANQQRAGIYLAHEFGHLLGLTHLRTTLGNNLMYDGISNGTRLSSHERQTASRNARHLVNQR